ncbi:hypothetical protein M2451_004095 [Dysgonomonas sp. PFB1-18]|uniref:TraL conjugative transposon family protein n=1 Tax=unclassified Dysgonomonas TaxID=2630389 RepID=UPI00247691C4|nr:MULTISPECIES: TraL conjugative transposon family protein [unclassified Dysgonomonas]MDH6311167.1 hypothetical protein [Dysgonomonas sp. PF1-14]MDH6341049.1 hypothetical protein [Dysgonomonas sp. PF1-16]MDH6382746.1 hypothetical protein [Dysgonomonas sp. PFB1-18]MDH6400039.1 hypothetical protein [Dysgonomonas sp. PF1-23]
MKERLKEIRYWLEDRLKGFCGELTPDKRITIILIMLLILTAGNLYFTFSTIYNWGKGSERKNNPDIEHIKKPELKRDRIKSHDFIDSPIPDKLFDLHKQRIRKDSIDSINSNKQNFKEYEWENKNKYGAKTKA